MISQHNRNKAAAISDPFELLDTDAKVAPILPRGKLDAMIGNALTHEQVLAPRKSASWWSGTGWWSGGLATAACLILFFTLFPQHKVQQFTAQASTQTQTTTTQTENFAQDSDDITDMMIYDSLSGF